MQLWLKEHHHAFRNRDMAAPAVAEHTLVTSQGVDLDNSAVLDSHPP